MLKKTAWTLIFLMLLAGCGQETGAGAMGSEVWTEMPGLTYGVLESEKLEILPWNSGRCEAVSENGMAETENGFYYVTGGLLYYTDKANPEKWIPVCNQPDCDHLDPTLCSASILGNEIIIREDRIYFCTDTDRAPHLYSTNGSAFLLASMKPDGTDRRLAYIIEDAILFDGGLSSCVLSPTEWIYMVSADQPDGSSVTRLFRATEAGVTEWPLENGGSGSGYMMSASRNGIRGERMFWSSVLGEKPGIYTRFAGTALETVDLTEVFENGGYFAENTLRQFRPGDGYYDVNLKTREETKLASPQLENSQADILLPNFILESTLLEWESTEGRGENVSHTMSLFDGQQWQNVTLPEELKNAPKTRFLQVLTVASEGVLLVSRDTRDNSVWDVYCIRLEEKEPKMIPFGAVIDPYYQQ